MKRLTRRKTLYGIGTAATTALLAGCVEDGDLDPGNGGRRRERGTSVPT